MSCKNCTNFIEKKECDCGYEDMAYLNDYNCGYKSSEMDFKPIRRL